MPTEMSAQEFAAKWRASALKESAAYQEQFLDLCRMLGEPSPAEADPGGNCYSFQKGVIKGGAPGEQETVFGPIPAGDWERQQAPIREAVGDLTFTKP